MKNPTRFIFTVTLVSAALSACGGGSSNDGANQTAASTAINQIGGTYIFPCEARTFHSLYGPNPVNSESMTATVVITPDHATGKASVSARYQYYENNTNCDAATLAFDMTFVGTASDRAGSKNYTNAAGKQVTAKVATIAYTGVTLSRGNLDFSLPTPGATTDMAYIFDNNALYLSKGRRGKDGLGDALTVGAVKQ